MTKNQSGDVSRIYTCVLLYVQLPARVRGKECVFFDTMISYRVHDAHVYRDVHVKDVDPREYHEDVREKGWSFIIKGTIQEFIEKFGAVEASHFADCYEIQNTKDKSAGTQSFGLVSERTVQGGDKYLYMQPWYKHIDLFDHFLNVSKRTGATYVCFPQGDYMDGPAKTAQHIKWGFSNLILYGEDTILHPDTLQSSPHTGTITYRVKMSCSPANITTLIGSVEHGIQCRKEGLGLTIEKITDHVTTDHPLEFSLYTKKPGRDCNLGYCATKKMAEDLLQVNLGTRRDKKGRTGVDPVNNIIRDTRPHVMEDCPYCLSIAENTQFCPLVFHVKIISTEEGAHVKYTVEIRMEKAVDDPPKVVLQNCTCVICLENYSNYILVPCGHLCLCNECAVKLPKDESSNKQKCPICKSVSDRIIKTYFVLSEEDSQNSKKQQVSGEGSSSASPPLKRLRGA
jgi:hypothetical protein